MDQRISQALEFARFRATQRLQQRQIWEEYQSRCWISWSDINLFVDTELIVQLKQQKQLFSEHDYAIVVIDQQPMRLNHEQLSELIDEASRCLIRAQQWWQQQHQSVQNSRSVRQITGISQ